VISASNVYAETYKSVIKGSKTLEKYDKAQIAATVFQVKGSGAIKDIYTRRFEENRKKSTHSIHIASLSKHFTGAAIAKLNISLDDKVSKHISNWPKYAKAVRIKHLLGHTSGLPDYTESGVSCTWTQFKPGKVIDWLNKSKNTKKGLKRTPGTKFRYNNTGYVVLARIVERKSGLTFPQYMKKKFFQPLKMKHTYLRGYESKRPKNFLRPRSGRVQNVVMNCDWFPGDGGVYTNIKDLKKWAVFLTGKSSLGNAVPRRMRTPSFGSYGYGIYLKSKVHGQSFINHGGSWRGARSEMYWDTKTNTFFFLLGNHKQIKKSHLAKKLIKLHYKK
jgi:CubicO group peptidase (beta-lactamase class C family)